MIAIIDYGMGNIHSVRKALEVMGGRTTVTDDARRIKDFDKVVLPGVGAFGDAMKELTRQGLADALQEHVSRKRILLGICLGMQLLFESSQESPGVKGLGIMKGEVTRFAASGDRKVPHMGWNQITRHNAACPLLNGIADRAFVYFCHSYYPCPQEANVAAAVTDYSGDFASLVWQDSVWGAQFHPEKSQRVGLQMIKNFVSI